MSNRYRTACPSCALRPSDDLDRLTDQRLEFCKGKRLGLQPVVRIAQRSHPGFAGLVGLPFLRILGSGVRFSVLAGSKRVSLGERFPPAKTENRTPDPFGSLVAARLWLEVVEHAGAHDGEGQVVLDEADGRGHAAVARVVRVHGYRVFR